MARVVDYAFCFQEFLPYAQRCKCAARRGDMIAQKVGRDGSIWLLGGMNERQFLVEVTRLSVVFPVRSDWK